MIWLTFPGKCILAFIGITASFFAARFSSRLLVRWFYSAWERNAAQMYEKMLPKWFLWSRVYIFSCTGYFNKVRNALYICYAASILSIAICIFIPFMDAQLYFYAGFLLALALFTMAECRVFDFIRGTDGRFYPIFDRCARLKAGELRRIRREKRSMHFTSVFGLFQKEVPLIDEDGEKPSIHS